MIPGMSSSEAVHAQYAPSVLQVEPHALPAMREAFDRALNLIKPHLRILSQDGFIAADWLGDESSAALKAFYNDRIMLADDGPFAALVKYQNILQSVRDQLAASESEYRRVEGENSELWGRV